MQWWARYARGLFWTVGFVEIYLGLWNGALYFTGHFPVRRNPITVAVLHLVAVALGALSCFTADAWRRDKPCARPLIIINILFCQVCFAFGVAAGAVGIYWCCSRKMRESEPAAGNFDHQPKPGDGASKWLQKAAPLVNLCGWVSTFINELDHAAAGCAVHMQLATFKAGPFAAQKLRGRWKFHLKLASQPSGIGGAVGTKPLHLNDLPKRMAFVAAGGPAASLLNAVAAFAVLLYTPGSPWEAWWQVPALVGAAAAAAAFLNLIPLGVGGTFSDGAHLVQMLRCGPEADRRVALIMMFSTTITPSRPRDLDPIALDRGTRAAVGDKLEGISHLMQVICAADCGDLGAARVHLERFLQRMPTPESAGRAASAVEMAFYIAYVDGNSIRAGEWLHAAEQLALKQNVSLADVIDYWITVTAAREAEGRKNDTDKAYGNAKRTAITRPAADRYRHEIDFLERAHNGDWLRSNTPFAEAVA